MNAWSNKTRVRGTVLFALDELRRTDRTGFEVRRFEAVGKVVMSRDSSLKDKMVMAALLAIEEIQNGSNATYRLERGRKKDEVIVFASHKMGPGDLLRDDERNTFRKFGLWLRDAIKVEDDQLGRLAKMGVKLAKDYRGRNWEEDRVLFFRPTDALDLLRA